MATKTKTTKPVVEEVPADEVVEVTEVVAEKEPVKTVKTKPAKVNVYKLNFRKEASAESEIIDTLDEGADVEVLETKKEWCKIVANGVEGFVMKEFITIAK